MSSRSGDPTFGIIGNLAEKDWRAGPSQTRNSSPHTSWHAAYFVSDQDVAVVIDASASTEARTAAVRRLERSDRFEVWDAVFALANDQDLPEPLTRAVGACLAHMAHRIRQPGALIRGKDENFLLRDFSQPAFDSYDTTTAELENTPANDVT